MTWRIEKNDTSLVNGLSIVDENNAIVCEPYRAVDGVVASMPGWCAVATRALVVSVLAEVVREHNKSLSTPKIG